MLFNGWTIDGRAQQTILLPVPRYKLLSTKAVWGFVKEVAELLQYFPDINDKELPDQAYMWTVLSTLKMDEWNKLIEEARKVRSINTENSNDSLIEIHPEILGSLLSVPLLSRGKQRIVVIAKAANIGDGHVAYLLKKSRQMKIKKKHAKTYTVNLQILNQAPKFRFRRPEARKVNREEEKEEEVDMKVDSQPQVNHHNKKLPPASDSIGEEDIIHF